MLALIRHAEAGRRELWEGDDRLRPLSRRGRAQAARLAEALVRFPFERVLASGYRRCVETVAPIAAARGLAVEPARELEEGAALDDTLVLLQRLSGTTAALCTHGDVMAAFCAHLAGLRLIRSGEAVYQKGGVWLLGEAGGELLSARYLPAPR